MPKMSTATLTAILASEKAAALSAMAAAKLTDERERAMKYYNGDITDDMPSETDRSKAVSFDVSDTVEGLMPAMMEIFAGGDEVVKFSPVSEEDVPQAEQETAYVNHVFMQTNPGFIVTYSMIKDALIQKNGVVKVSWVVDESEERETYYDQPDDVYALFMADDDIKIVEHTEHPADEPTRDEDTAESEADEPTGGPPDTSATLPTNGAMTSPQVVASQGPVMPPTGLPPGLSAAPGPDQSGAGGPPPGVASSQTLPGPPAPEPVTLHDFTTVRARKVGRCVVDPVPPEEFGVARRSKLGQPLDYSFHETRKTQSDLIDQGFDADQIEGLPTGAPDLTTEAIARDTVDETQGARADLNKANREIAVTEHYVKLDYEGDGKAALYCVTTAGDSATQILKRDGEDDIYRVDFDPFAAITPFIVTHRWFGRSVADLVIEVQRIKSSLLRGALDNIYGANNNRLIVSAAHEHAKTLDDILDNRINGIIRVKQPGGIEQLQNTPIGDFVFPMIEYQDQVREWRTGVSRHGQGLNSDALKDIGDDARQQMMDAVAEKSRLIARIFAETGFKDLFWKIHATLRKHGTKQTVQLKGKWVTVDPREWKRRDHLTASVGLGNGSKAAQMAFWRDVITSQQESLTAVPGLTDPDKIYNATERYMELAGHRDVSRYWTKPSEAPPQQPAPDPNMVKVKGQLMIAAQTAQAKQQSDAQAAMAAQQRDAAAAQASQQRDATEALNDQAVEASRARTEIAKAHLQIELQRQQMMAKIALEREQAAAQIELDRQQMMAQVALHREQMAREPAKTNGSAR